MPEKFVYCVMEKDLYDCSGETPDALCSIWKSRAQAEIEAQKLNEENDPYEYIVSTEILR